MKNLLISIILCIGTHLYAQTIEKFSIDSGGGIANNGSLKVLYTVGEVNIQEYNINSLYISEGFIDNFILGSLGIEDKYSSQISIYPNPVSEFFYIKTNIVLDKVEIYDILGSKILKTSAQKIDVSNFHSGIYIVKIFSDNDSQMTKKVIIK